MSKNKIKYNLKNAHYAPHVVGENGAITFATPVRIPGAVSISLDAKGEISIFYADGIEYHKAAANNGYDGDAEFALIPDGFRTDILGETLDEQKVLIETSGSKQTAFALIFEFDGDERAIRHVLYNCSATRPSIASKTKEETIDPSTETIKISATPLEDGRVKAKSSEETDETVYNNWYKAVYETTPATPEVMKSVLEDNPVVDAPVAKAAKTEVAK